MFLIFVIATPAGAAVRLCNWTSIRLINNKRHTFAISKNDFVCRVHVCVYILCALLKCLLYVTHTKFFHPHPSLSLSSDYFSNSSNNEYERKRLKENDFKLISAASLLAAWILNRLHRHTYSAARFFLFFASMTVFDGNFSFVSFSSSLHKISTHYVCWYWRWCHAMWTPFLPDFSMVPYQNKKNRFASVKIINYNEMMCKPNNKRAREI